MAYSKNISVDENGPKITTNGTVVFKDLTLSLQDFNPTVTKWSSSTTILNKGEELLIDGKWSFLYVRMRWLDYNGTDGTSDGAASIYNACSSNASIASACGCSSGTTPSDGKTPVVPSLATVEMTQYTEYLLSPEFGYLDTPITLGATGAEEPLVKDLYDHSFSAVLSNDIIFFKGATGYSSNMDFTPTFANSVDSSGAAIMEVDFISSANKVDIGDILYVNNFSPSLSGYVEVVSKTTAPDILGVEWVESNENPVVGWGATTVISIFNKPNQYPVDGEYYSYTNQNKDVLYIYDVDVSEWKLIYTDTDISELDGTENTLLNILNDATWSTESYELGNSATYLPELSNTNGTFLIEDSIDLEDDNMPTTFKFTDVLMLTSHKYTGKIISDLDNQEINIMLGY